MNGQDTVTADAFNPSSLDAVASRLASGATVGHYKTIRLIGRGGMAEVYLARDTQLGRKVVLKLILTSEAPTQQHIEQLTQEAHLLAQFNHPHIVTLYDFGQHESEPFLVMEFVEGETLRARLQGEPLSVREVERYALAIASALREAHASNVVHGDLKPENILIARDGRLRVADFGLAKLFSPAEREFVAAAQRPFDAQLEREQALLRDTEKTMIFEGAGAAEGLNVSTTSTVRGTPNYMAPEQWAGELRTPATDM